MRHLLDRLLLVVLRRLCRYFISRRYGIPDVRELFIEIDFSAAFAQAAGPPPKYYTLAEEQKIKDIDGWLKTMWEVRKEGSNA